MTEQYLDELIRNYAEGRATPEEEELLMQWYRTGPVGDVAWPAFAADEKQSVHHRMLQRLQRDTLPRKGRLLRLARLRAAAVLLLVMGAAALVYLLKPGAPGFITVANPSHRVQLLRLPDSSQVWLNAGTTISYNKDFARQRMMHLVGEAFF